MLASSSSTLSWYLLVGLVVRYGLCSCPLGPTREGGHLTAISLPAGCAMPLGMETGAIADRQISASSVHLGFMALQRWAPELARLHRSGIVNAWTASNYDRNPWIQVWKQGGGEGKRRDEGCLHLGVTVGGLIRGFRYQGSWFSR